MSSSHLPRTFTEDAAIRARRDAHIERECELERHAQHLLKVREDTKTELIHAAAHNAEKPFNPTPMLRSQVITDFCLDTSIGEIVNKTRTSVEQLCLWLKRPDVRSSIQAVKEALALKIELNTLNKTEGFMGALSRMVDSYHEYESSFGCLTGSDQDAKKTLRNRENIVKAIRTFKSLSTHCHITPAPYIPSPLIPNIPTHTPGMSEPDQDDRSQDDATRLANPADTPQAPELAAPISQPAPLREPPAPLSITPPAEPPDAPTVHPDAQRFPAKQPQRDPHPETHPAVLSGAASSPHAPTSRPPSSAPMPERWTSCTTCTRSCPGNPARSQPPP